MNQSTQTQTTEPIRRKPIQDICQVVNITLPLWIVEQLESLPGTHGKNRSQKIKTGLMRAYGLERPKDQ